MKGRGFFCPHCGAKLSRDLGDTVAVYGMLSGEHFSVGSIFVLSAQFGIYGGKPQYKGLVLKPGAKVDFCCPERSCRHSFQAAYDEDLAEILWVDDNAREHMVAFSRSMGREMTFIIDVEKGEMVAVHGRHRSELTQRIRKHLVKNPYKPAPFVSAPP